LPGTARTDVHLTTPVPPVDVMIVGAQKSGTSTLLHFLGQHPGVQPQTRPELVWLMDDRQYGQGGFDGWDDYYFDGPAAGRLRLGKLAGLMSEPAGLERLHALNGDVTISVILREPVARAYSAFWFFRAEGREPAPTFEAALDGDPARFGSDTESRRICAYRDRSQYAPHIADLYDRFGRDSVDVIFLDDFKGDPAGAVAPLVTTLGLDVGELPALAGAKNTAKAPRSETVAKVTRARGPLARAVRPLVPRNLRAQVRRRLHRMNQVAIDTPPIDPSTDARLRDEFAGANRALEELLGRPVPGGWSISRD
jgi:hypothetical protein